MRIYILIIAIVLFSGNLFSQVVKVTGTVTDTNRETLPGVSIMIKGTQKGTITDIDGNYIVEIPKGSTLEYSFVGMVKQSVRIDKSSVINIQMVSDAINLEEVVAIGYGITKKVI